MGGAVAVGNDRLLVVRLVCVATEIYRLRDFAVEGDAKRKQSMERVIRCDTNDLYSELLFAGKGKRSSDLVGASSVAVVADAYGARIDGNQSGLEATYGMCVCECARLPSYRSI